MTQPAAQSQSPHSDFGCFPRQPQAPLPVPARSALCFTRQLGRSSWLASADGDLVVARPATAVALEPSSPDRQSALETLSSLTAVRSPHLVPFLGMADYEGVPWLLSDHVDGVCLQRLLTVATLTPVQAVYIAVQVLAGLTQLHDAELAHGRLVGMNVLVGRDGEPRLTDWAVAMLAGTRTMDELRSADREGARLLIAELARNADRPVVRRRGRHQTLLNILQRLGNGDAMAAVAVSARELSGALLSAVGEDTGLAATRIELGALVKALAERSTPIAGVSATTVAARSRSTQTDAARVSWRRPVGITPTLPAALLSQVNWRRPRRRLWYWLVAAGVAIVLLAAAGYLYARNPISSFADRLLPRHVAGAKLHETKPAPGPTKPTTGRSRALPLPVPSLAPLTAGTISGVSIRPLATCTPGHSCPIRVTVRFAPAYTGEEVLWSIAVVNRCTGAATNLPGGSVTGRPGTYVYDTNSVRLPAVRSLAVIAVTEAPARAASRPLLVPAGGGTC